MSSVVVSAVAGAVGVGIAQAAASVVQAAQLTGAAAVAANAALNGTGGAVLAAGEKAANNIIDGRPVGEGITAESTAKAFLFSAAASAIVDGAEKLTSVPKDPYLGQAAYERMNGHILQDNANRAAIIRGASQASSDIITSQVPEAVINKCTGKQ